MQPNFGNFLAFQKTSDFPEKFRQQMTTCNMSVISGKKRKDSLRQLFFLCHSNVLVILRIFHFGKIGIQDFLHSTALFHCLRVAGRTRRPPMLYFTVQTTNLTGKRAATSSTGLTIWLIVGHPQGPIVRHASFIALWSPSF